MARTPKPLRIRMLIAVYAVAALAVSVSADQIDLTTGGSLHGKAFREDGMVRIELEDGTIVVPEFVVERILPGASPAEVKEARQTDRRTRLGRRIEVVGLDDAQSLYRIAREARLEGFPEDEIRSVLGLVLGADPDHAGARAELGEVRYSGRWVAREEARRLEERHHAETMRDRGFILHDGEWMKPDEIDWRQVEGDWRRKVQSLENELAEAEFLIESLFGERDTAVIDAQTLSDQLEAAYGELDAARSEVEQLAIETNQLEADLGSLEGELQFCQGALYVCQTELVNVPPCDCSGE